MLFLNVVLPMDSRIGASLYIVCHGCKGKVQPPFLVQCSEMILRLCDSAQRHASETLRGAFWNWNWEETRHTLDASSLEAHIELHVGSIDEAMSFPLCSDTVGVLSKLVE